MHLTVADWSLLALWGDTAAVHVALYDPDSRAIGVASLICPDGHFPSLSGVRPGALRLERAAQDLFGLTADGLEDARPWLDHGQWPESHPQMAQPQPAVPRPATQYAFLPVEGEGIHQIAVGPVHAGIIEPGGFRFHCNGEAVVRLEERLGYTHKGIERLMVGQPPGGASRIAARLSGDSTVACSLAFARAAEAATGTAVPVRAIYLRALMGELERIANHLGDIGAICNDAAFAFMLAHFSVLREDVLRAAQACFGHRLMMDCVVPGGVACDLDTEGVARLRELSRTCVRGMPSCLPSTMTNPHCSTAPSAPASSAPNSLSGLPPAAMSGGRPAAISMRAVIRVIHPMRTSNLSCR